MKLVSVRLMLASSSVPIRTEPAASWESPPNSRLASPVMWASEPFGPLMPIAERAWLAVLSDAAHLSTACCSPRFRPITASSPYECCGTQDTVPFWCEGTFRAALVAASSLEESIRTCRSPAIPLLFAETVKPRLWKALNWSSVPAGMVMVVLAFLLS